MFKTALLVLVIAVVAIEINFQNKNGQLVQQVLAAETDYQSSISVLQKQIDYWQEVVITHPDYRDGYLLLALLNSEIGKKDAAQSWIKRIYVTDPNYVLNPDLTTQLSQPSP